ncbi:MAG: EI24 domain-containing protein [Alphaproteobacteria bacterium]|nr:EI24 domain-containing protein [Alphaproteobacteria bacterium]
MFDRKFRGVLWLGVAGTVGLFLALTLVLQWSIRYVPDFGFHWIQDATAIISQFLLLIAFVFMGAPVAQLFASFFIDRVAAAVEVKYYPQERQAGGATFNELLTAGLSFTAISVGLNLLAFPLQIAFVGVGTLVVLFVNGYLTARTFFELAALRHMSWREANLLRRKHRVRLFLGGALISLLAMVPFLNFFVPLFGTAMMTHEYNKLARSG